MADLTGTTCIDLPPRGGGALDVPPALLQQGDEGEAARASGIHVTPHGGAPAGRATRPATAPRTPRCHIHRGAR